MFASKDLFFTPLGGGYTFNRSLRFRSSASAYLNRTPASAGNRQKWTWSAWVKRGGLTTPQFIMFSATSGTGTCQIGFQGSGNDGIVLYDSSLGPMNVTTTSQYRDPSAWYHIVIAVDTTQATAANRVLMYVNGVQITSFSTATYPSQNANTGINNNVTHGLATQYSNGSNAGNYFDGYMTEVNFVDGQALTPSSFGAYNAITGVWQPIKYTGTYGNNGFYLNFNNNASTTTLGYDTSGNSNNWTTNNISLTAGATYDSMTDVPTLTSATVANYCVLNPLNHLGTITPSNGNLTVIGAADNAQVSGTIGMDTGKWYYEHTITAIGGEQSVGIGGSLAPYYVGGGSTQYGYYAFNGNKYNNLTNTAYGATFTTGDVIGVAYDAGAGSLTFYKNGVSQGVAFTGITGTMYPLVASRATGGTNQSDLNFGQRPFSYTPPTGFVALNTYNLPTPSISNGANYFAATTYTGSASTQVINSNMTTLNFAWIKDRTSANSHVLVDTVRGGSPMLTLYSNLTAAEDNSSPNYNPTSISGNSITLGGGKIGINTSGDNYVMWGWSAGSGTSSNTNGSITSTVSVNATAGFSVVTYTGTGSNATVGHGLGVQPKMVIIKQRNAVTNWAVNHSGIWSTGQGVMYLNLTNASANDATFWNSTNPTSSVIYLGTNASVNGSTGTFVAYCWSEVAGFSKFGSYTGNGSTDGPFVYCGFRPRFVMIKSSSLGSTDWFMLDSSRNTYNVANSLLLADSSGAESTATVLDFNSNGFKLRDASNGDNAVSQTYIYAAFAENPFKNSLAR